MERKFVHLTCLNITFCSDGHLRQALFIIRGVIEAKLDKSGMQTRHALHHHIWPIFRNMLIMENLFLPSTSHFMHSLLVEIVLLSTILVPVKADNSNSKIILKALKTLVTVRIMITCMLQLRYLLD